MTVKKENETMTVRIEWRCINGTVTSLRVPLGLNYPEISCFACKEGRSDHHAKYLRVVEL